MTAPLRENSGIKFVDVQRMSLMGPLRNGSAMPVQVETIPALWRSVPSPPNSLSKYVLISAGSVLVSAPSFMPCRCRQVALMRRWDRKESLFQITFPVRGWA